MTLKQCFDAIGGNYADVTARFGGERLAIKFTLKFPSDPSYEELKSSLAAGDMESAFRAAHTLKGVCQNLGFDALYSHAYEVCEALRADDAERAKALFPALEESYFTTIAAIKELGATI